jgi:hypothetical protein
MTSTTEKQETATQPSTEARNFRGLPARLLVELVIGLGLAAVIMLVAWSSSNAIHFVYGGY